MNIISKLNGRFSPILIALIALLLVGCQRESKTDAVPTLMPTAAPIVLELPDELDVAPVATTDGIAPDALGDETAATAPLAPSPMPTTPPANQLPPTFTPNSVEVDYTQATPLPTYAPNPTRTPFVRLTATAVPYRTAAPNPISGEAFKLLRRAEDNLSNSVALKHQRSVVIDSPYYNQTESVTCSMVLPTTIYCAVYRNTVWAGYDAQVEDFEFIQRGRDVWVRNAGEDAWTSRPATSENYLQAQLSQLQSSPYVTAVSTPRETTFDGTAVYEVQISLNPDRTVREFFGTEMYESFRLNSTLPDFQATLLIDRNSEQIKQVILAASFILPDGGTVQIQAEDTLTQFNEPIDIPNPE